MLVTLYFILFSNNYVEKVIIHYFQLLCKLFVFTSIIVFVEVLIIRLIGNPMLVDQIAPFHYDEKE